MPSIPFLRFELKPTMIRGDAQAHYLHLSPSFLSLVEGESLLPQDVCGLQGNRHA
jgi:hypothetical protein